MSRLFPIAAKYSTSVVELDRKTNQALVRSANRITRLAEVARVAMDEMSVNYVTAEQLGSQALTAAQCLASRGPQTEVAESYLNALTQHYLTRMVGFTNLANDLIIRRAFVDDDD